MLNALPTGVAELEDLLRVCGSPGIVRLNPLCGIRHGTIFWRLNQWFREQQSVRAGFKVIMEDAPLPDGGLAGDYLLQWREHVEQFM